MKETAIIVGLLLTGLGLFGYFNPVQAKDAAATEQTQDTDANSQTDDGKVEAKKTGSPTALIPAFFGLPLMICGTLGFLESLRKHMMHIAAGIALVGGLLAGGRGLMKVGALFGDDPVAQRATAMVLIMAVLCLLYVLMSVRSFIAARKTREALEAKAA
jgi:ABC-type Na+ efflux pump permease subunit